MTLLAVLIALVLDKTWEPVANWRSFSWFAGLVQWSRARFSHSTFWAGPAGAAALVMGPVLLLGLVQHSLGEIFGLLGFAFGVAVLFYCLGPGDSQKLAHDYLNAREVENHAVANAKLRQLLGRDAAPESPGLARELSEVVMLRHYEDMLAVLLWFAVLGPMGALLYRLGANLHHQTRAPDANPQLALAAERLFGILLWLPAQATALGFALAGSFVDALRAWQEPFDHEPAPAGVDIARPWWNAERSRALVLRTGLGALLLNRVETDEQWDMDDLRAALALNARSLIVWVVVLALLTLAGLAS